MLKERCDSIDMVFRMYKFWGLTDKWIIGENKIRQFIHVKAGTMEGIFSMEKWRSIAAGMSCLSMLFATGAVTVSASDENHRNSEHEYCILSMWKKMNHRRC